MGIFSRPKLKIIESDGQMKKDFPIFFHWINDRSYLESEVSANDTDLIEFRMPIVTYGNIMGYNYCGIEKINQKFFLYLNSVSRRGNKIIGKKIQIYKDETTDSYNDLFKELSIYLMLETDYLKMTSGEI
jgi:hypothetical protein